MDIGQRAKSTGLSDDFEILWCQFIKARHTDHEKLETRITVGHGIGHFGDDLRGGIKNRWMQTVVNDRLASGLLLPGFDTALNRLARFGQRIVHDGRYSATGCGER